MGIAAVAIAASNLSIPVVNSQFRLLIPTDFPSPVNCSLFGIVVATCPVGASAFYIPSPFRVRDHMMFFWSFGH
jgi:hypothetical protein